MDFKEYVRCLTCGALIVVIAGTTWYIGVHQGYERHTPIKSYPEPIVEMDTTSATPGSVIFEDPIYGNVMQTRRIAQYQEPGPICCPHCGTRLT